MNYKLLFFVVFYIFSVQPISQSQSKEKRWNTSAKVMPIKKVSPIEKSSIEKENDSLKSELEIIKVQITELIKKIKSNDKFLHVKYKKNHLRKRTIISDDNIKNTDTDSYNVPEKITDSIKIAPPVITKKRTWWQRLFKPKYNQ